MRIGILTDIHEAVDHLRTALAVLDAERVDHVVQLGDACDLYGPGSRTAEVAELLAAAGVAGVWGNHDIGLCHEVPDRVRERADTRILAYMSTMRPRLELGGCHFSHVDPCMDPLKAEEIWLCAEPPTPDVVARCFAAVPHRVSFIGHYHRWLALAANGPLPWRGECPLALDPAERYLVVVGPLVGGHFAVYDTDTGVLTPFRCRTRAAP